MIQRLVDRLITTEWEPNVFAYLDDIVITTDTEDKNLEMLRKVLNALSEAQLGIKKRVNSSVRRSSTWGT